MQEGEPRGMKGRGRGVGVGEVTVIVERNDGRRKSGDDKRY